MTIDLGPRSKLILAAVLAFVTLGGQAAVAQPVINKPVYNPESKSYFELVRDDITNGSGQGGGGQGPGWGEAKQLAAKRYFKGIQGRLAMISSAQTELFIITSLRPTNPTWFGVYYDCASRNLRWASGEPLQNGAYTHWDPENWNRMNGDSFCFAGANSMPGFLAEAKYWALQGPSKHYNFYLVEYPTTAAEPAKAAAKPAEPAAAAEAATHSRNEE